MRCNVTYVITDVWQSVINSWRYNRHDIGGPIIPIELNVMITSSYIHPPHYELFVRGIHRTWPPMRNFDIPFAVILNKLCEQTIKLQWFETLEGLFNVTVIYSINGNQIILKYGDCLNIGMPSYPHGDSHHKNNAITWSFDIGYFYTNRKVVVAFIEMLLGEKDLEIFDSDDGWFDRRQAIIWGNAGILLIEYLSTNSSEIWIKTENFSFRKMHLKMPFCPWGDELKRLMAVWYRVSFLFKIWTIRCLCLR